MRRIADENFALYTYLNSLCTLARAQPHEKNCTSCRSNMMQFDSRHQTDRLRSVRSCNYALRENGRPIAGGRFLCAEGQAVPSSRWTGFVVPVTSPDPKGNRYRNRARVNTFPSKGRGTRRIGATGASNSGDQTRFLSSARVFPGNAPGSRSSMRPTSGSTSDRR